MYEYFARYGDVGKRQDFDARKKMCRGCFSTPTRFQTRLLTLIRAPISCTDILSPALGED
jgi:hypothetical protein